MRAERVVRPRTFLAISGSLRAGASNTTLLQAAALLVPAGVTVELYEHLGELPHYNPDLDGPNDLLPPRVAELRARVGAADGLLLSTPEYAHGLPGSFKNLLDWLVSSVEFPAKPVATFTASARATYAQAQLRETLITMSARLVDGGSATLALPSRSMDVDAILADTQISTRLRGALRLFADAIREGR